MSLPESRALALENNLELKAALVSPAIAGAQLNQEEAKFEASFFANLNANKVNQPSIGILGQISGSQSESLGGDLGVQVPLTTGGTVTFDASDQWNKSNAGLLIRIQSLLAVQRLDLDQPAAAAQRGPAGHDVLDPSRRL